MPTLSQIIEATAARMSGVTVDVRSIFGTVCISDDSGQHEDIFMQGDDAVTFINERDALYEKTGDMSERTIELFLAEPYVENIWS